MTLLDILSGVGTVLDTPGAMVRTGLAGENPFEAVFDTDKRVSGRDLLERYGMVGANADQGWIPDAGDIGGFAVEALLDPINLIGLGAAKKAAQASKVARRSNADSLARYADDAWDTVRNNASAERYDDYFTPDGVLTHRRHSPKLSPHIMQFADTWEANSSYGPHKWILQKELPLAREDDRLVKAAQEMFGVDKEQAIDLIDPPYIVNDAGAWDSPEFVSEVWESFAPDGYRTNDGAVLINRNPGDLRYVFEDPDVIPDKVDPRPMPSVPKLQSIPRDARSALMAAMLGHNAAARGYGE